MDFQNNLLLFNKNRFPDFFYSLFLEIKLKLLTTIFDRFIRVWIVATAAQKNLHSGSHMPQKIQHVI